MTERKMLKIQVTKQEFQIKKLKNLIEKKGNDARAHVKELEEAILLLNQELENITKKYRNSEEALAKLIKVHELQEEYTKKLESTKDLNIEISQLHE